MQLIDGTPVYSATDLVGFLECGHLTNLERAALAQLVKKPVRQNDEIELIARRGLDHEHRYLERLRADGRTVASIERDGSGSDQGTFLRAAAADTQVAMRAGAQVIYQATFFDGRWRGHADFLHRIEAPSLLGAWSYAVADTKLARHVKPGALLQMCVYSDLLAKVQGVEPPWMEVALGGSARQVDRFRVADYLAYYRRARRRFEALMARSDVAYPVTVTYPEPVEHCEVCRWAVLCGPERRRDDHLSLVAGISRRQRQRLATIGVDTVAALGELPIPVRPPLDGISDQALERVREQARLQMEGRRQDKVLFELLGPIEALRGLALLPEPSPGDLFFDIEGDPFVEEDGSDGLEYLFGVVDQASGFHAFWGTDRAAEKRAFEDFIDFVMGCWEADPNLHIYHYGAYEPSHVKKLMGLHATREDEVDRLLRGGVFIDLYRVVQQGIRVSQESYSIKKLEPLYGLTREIALRDAGSSIVNFELWLDGGRANQPLLDLIEAYNRDDCVSNLELRDWLESRRADVVAGGTDVPRPAPQEAAPTADLSEKQAAVEALVARLTSDLPPMEDRTPDQQATWLLAQLLDWHRREEKATWWKYFEFLAMTDEELLDDRESIGGLSYDGVVGSIKRSLIHRYRFPPQENAIREGAGVVDPATGDKLGKVRAIDQIAGTVELTRVATSDPFLPSALIPHEFIPTDDQKRALMELGSWVAEHGIDAPGPRRAARDLLLRRPPRVGQNVDAPLRGTGETPLDAAIRIGMAMDHSVLAIQGPPGSGKTYTGAEMIVRLVRDGRKVGVTANSHKVIGNLLDAVVRAARKAEVPVRIGQKPGREAATTCSEATSYDDPGLAAALANHEVDVAGGTAWLWANPVLADSVDVLFVDEAGQTALANTLAISGAAESIVLLGDPQQLEQPIQGSHPPGAEASALQHLLGELQTIPDTLGLFLERTWRLHPDLCAFTSEQFYDDRLRPKEHLERQVVQGDGPLSGSGVRWVSVPHEANVNSSAEEVETVARICSELLGRTWVNEHEERRVIDWADILIIAPYNAQVAALADRLGQPERVGTVDKFQGREAAVAIYSLATSSADLAPRGMDFLYSRNRLNVATSRARCLSIVVGSPALLDVVAHSPTQMRLANSFCRLVEVAESG